MDQLAELRRGASQCTQSPWTDERVARLKARWSQGVSARQIARELGGGLSRSAVLGKIHRLEIAELSPHAWVYRPQRGGGEPRPVFFPRGKRPFGGAHPSRQWLGPIWVIEAEPYVDDPGRDADIPFVQRRSLLELTRHDCRWPVGDPGTADFFFCGAEALRGEPYCRAHGERCRRAADDVLQGKGGARRRRTSRRFVKPAAKAPLNANGARRADDRSF
jgi:GcrA cell cycle regulator